LDDITEPLERAYEYARMACIDNEGKELHKIGIQVFILKQKWCLAVRSAIYLKQYIADESVKGLLKRLIG